MSILPGATLGVLGGGQLGRMFTIAARTMGYDVIVLDPNAESPAGSIANRHLRAGYDDPAALRELGNTCAAITTEFENVPAASLRALSAACVVHPSAANVAILQDRIREKQFLRDNGLPTPRFHVIETMHDLDAACAKMHGPCILKVSRFGYDGKGQARVAELAAARTAFKEMGSESCVLEEWLSLQTEISVIIARGADGLTTHWPVAENQHREGILDVTIVPARVPDKVAGEAIELARALADKLDYVGIMAVEFFVLGNGELRINEIAPRPHNSGHFTIDACVTSQFAQQVRTLCGLPLGDTRLLSPVVMINLLGDLWAQGSPPWQAALQHSNVKLHLYGKQDARVGRKMGHINCLHEDPEKALALALAIKTEFERAAETRRQDVSARK